MPFEAEDAEQEIEGGDAGRAPYSLSHAVQRKGPHGSRFARAVYCLPAAGEKIWGCFQALLVERALLGQPFVARFAMGMLFFIGKLRFAGSKMDFF